MERQDLFFRDRRLSIIVVTQQIGRVISGIGLYAHNLVEYLLADGNQVCVIAPENQRPSGRFSYTFVGVPPPIAGNTQARWVSLSISFARELRRMEGKKQFDLVHFTDGREALFCKFNIPMIGNINDTYAASINPLSYYRSYFNDWLLRWVYYYFVHACEPVALQHLQAIIANSNYTAQVMTDAYHISKQKLYVCHKSIMSGQYKTALSLHDQANPHHMRVLFVGGNMQRKGLPILINAAPRVLEAFPEVEFWIAGEDKAEPAMRMLCNQAGVSKHFHFWGWQSQSDLKKLYSQADIFVMPSLTEAFGMVFLEAMAAGLPVIGTRVGGVPEIIVDGSNGILVDPGKINELGETIVQLLGNQKLRKKLCLAGFTTAQRFDVKSMMHCTYEIYQKVLSAH